MSQTVRQYLASTSLRALAFAYSGNCWASWKVGKTNDLNNPDNPFLGGPSVLINQGITELEGVGGKTITVTPLTRIRVKDLSEASLERLGIAGLKGSGPGKDVVHQEFVETFDECVALDKKHLMNNYVGAAAVVDGLVSYAMSQDATVADLIAFIEKALAGDESTGVLVSLMSRMSWIGRACMDGSYADSGDFVFAFTLTDNTAAIDSYVAVPVMKMFLSDLVQSQNANS